MTLSRYRTLIIIGIVVKIEKDDMYYLDCFCYGAICGDKFPVNSYSNESPEVLLDEARKMLLSKKSGIDEIRISRKTVGQAVMPVERNDNV